MATRAVGRDSEPELRDGADADGARDGALRIAVEDADDSSGGGIPGFVGDLFGGGGADAGGGDAGAPRGRKPRKPRTAQTPPARSEVGDGAGGIAKTVRNLFRFAGHQGHKTFGPGPLYQAASFWEYDREELDIVEGLSKAAFRGADFEDAPPKVAIGALVGFGIITFGLRAWQTQQLIAAVRSQNAALVAQQAARPSSADWAPAPAPPTGAGDQSDGYVNLGKRGEYNAFSNADMTAAG